MHNLLLNVILWLLQEKIIDDLGMEMDSTSNRLDFVQVFFPVDLVIYFCRGYKIWDLITYHDINCRLLKILKWLY